jgi:transmembrane sensor
MADHDRETGTSGSPDWEALSRYLAGESDRAERSRIEAELAANPERSALVSALDAALPAPATGSVSPREMESALQSVLARREETTPLTDVRTFRPRWRIAGMRAAAAIVILIGGALVWRLTSSQRTSGGKRVAHGVARPLELATGVGVIDSLVLPDSSLVILGPRSSLTVAANYGVSSRELTLRGQGYFDVRHDPSRPFVVHTAIADLLDVGTRFSVNSDPADSLRVVVLGGAVAIRPAGQTEPRDTLSAQDRGAISLAGVLVVERQAATGGEDMAWMTQRIVLRDAPVARVAAELARWKGLELRVTDSAMRTRRLTATFATESRQEIARVLAAALGGTARLTGDTLWVVPASAAPKLH